MTIARGAATNGSGTPGTKGPKILPPPALDFRVAVQATLREGIGEGKQHGHPASMLIAGLHPTEKSEEPINSSL